MIKVKGTPFDDNLSAPTGAKAILLGGGGSDTLSVWSDFSDNVGNNGSIIDGGSGVDQLNIRIFSPDAFKGGNLDNYLSKYFDIKNVEKINFAFDSTSNGGDLRVIGSHLSDRFTDSDAYYRNVFFNAGKGDDWIPGGFNADNNMTLHGGAGDDIVEAGGSFAKAYMFGDSGNDLLQYDHGNVTMNGGGGNDSIVFDLPPADGEKADAIGGAGKDTFYFEANTDYTSGKFIDDFTNNVDKIGLFYNGSVGPDGTVPAAEQQAVFDSDLLFHQVGQDVRVDVWENPGSATPTISFIVKHATVDEFDVSDFVFFGNNFEVKHGDVPSN